MYGLLGFAIAALFILPADTSRYNAPKEKYVGANQYMGRHYNE